MGVIVKKSTVDSSINSRIILLSYSPIQIELSFNLVNELILRFIGLSSYIALIPITVNIPVVKLVEPSFPKIYTKRG